MPCRPPSTARTPVPSFLVFAVEMSLCDRWRPDRIRNPKAKEIGTGGADSAIGMGKRRQMGQHDKRWGPVNTVKEAGLVVQD